MVALGPSKTVSFSEEFMDLVTSGKNKSAWFMDAKPVDYAKLAADITVDDVIVGGGISGVTVAYLLSKAGRNVALVEDGYIGSGESGRTTAHLTYAVDARCYRVKDMLGEDAAKAVMESHKEAIDTVEKIVAEEKIDCDFKRVNGYLYPRKPSDSDELAKELEVLRQIGNNEVEMVEKSGTKPFDPGRCLLFPRQAQFNPLKYLAGLCGAIVRQGGKIFTETHVTDFEKSGVKTAEGYRVNAQNVIVTTNAPVHTTVKMHDKQAPYRTFVVATKVPKGSVTSALLWSTSVKDDSLGNSYTYIRTSPFDKKCDMLIVGDLDHKTGQADDGNKRLTNIHEWIKQHFPSSGEVLYSWSGQVVNSAGGLAFIGREKDNFYVATGFSGNGMTYGAISGLLVRDLILGKENVWAKIYDPARKIPEEAKGFVVMSEKGAKKVISSIVEEEQAKELKCGSGIVADQGITGRAAVYKDEKGEVHSSSALCRHMGCTVAWNPTERTFDCPCHGSRYTGFGKVVNGPSNANLKKA